MSETHADSAASHERLWSTVSDVTAWPRHLPTFTSVTPAGPAGAPGRGSRFEVRQPGLRPTTYEVTDWIVGSSFTWEARSPGIVTTATHRVEPAGGGSRLTVSVGWEGALAGLVGRLLGSRTRAMLELEATTLARVAEAGG